MIRLHFVGYEVYASSKFKFLDAEGFEPRENHILFID
jgi:hypothetical protein